MPKYTFTADLPEGAGRWVAALVRSAESYMKSYEPFWDDSKVFFPRDSVAGRVEDFIGYLINAEADYAGEPELRKDCLADLYRQEGWGVRVELTDEDKAERELYASWANFRVTSEPDELTPFPSPEVTREPVPRYLREAAMKSTLLANPKIASTFGLMEISDLAEELMEVAEARMGDS